MIELYSFPAIEPDKVFLYNLLSLFFMGFIWILVELRSENRRWREGFGPEFKVVVFLRQAIKFIFTRWWLIVIGLLASITYSSQGNLLLWLSYSIFPEHLDNWKEKCSQLQFYPSPYPALALLGVEIREAVNSALHSPGSIWQIYFGFPLIVVVLLLMLIWMNHVATKWKKNGLHTNFMIFLVFQIFLIMGMVSWVGYFFFFMNSYNFSDFNFDVPITLQIIGIFVSAIALDSAWLGLIWKIYEDSGKKARDNSEKLSSIASYTLKVFPMMMILGIMQGAIAIYQFPWTFKNEEQGFITYIPAALRFLLTYQLPESLSVIFAWICFPLPFLALKYQMSLGQVSRRFQGLWKREFRKLVTIGAIIVCLNTIPDIFEAISKQYWPPEPLNYENCMRFYLWPDWRYILKKIFGVITVLWSLFIMIIVFQSAVFDQPKHENR